jgi:hypothetical protein
MRKRSLRDDAPAEARANVLSDADDHNDHRKIREARRHAEYNSVASWRS